MAAARLYRTVRAAVAGAPPAPTPAPLPVPVRMPTADAVAVLAARTWGRARPADRTVVLLALAWDVRHAGPVALDAVTDAVRWAGDDHPMATPGARDRARLLYRTADARALADGATTDEDLGAALILAALAVRAQEHPGGAAPRGDRHAVTVPDTRPPGGTA